MGLLVFWTVLGVGVVATTAHAVSTALLLRRLRARPREKTDAPGR